MRQRLRVWSIVFGVLAAAPAHASNIVLNPSFEGGTDPWFISDLFEFEHWRQLVGGATGLHRSGSDAISTSCFSFGQFDCSLSQFLPTTAGTVYDLSFWVAEVVLHSQMPPAANALRVVWDNGASVTTFNLPANRSCTEITQNNWDCLWVQYTVTGLVAASDGSVLEFLGFDNAGDLLLDDVVVTAQGMDDLPDTSEVPEPATMGLLGAGLVVIAAQVRRRRRGRSEP